MIPLLATLACSQLDNPQINNGPKLIEPAEEPEPTNEPTNEPKTTGFDKFPR